MLKGSQNLSFWLCNKFEEFFTNPQKPFRQSNIRAKFIPNRGPYLEEQDLGVCAVSAPVFGADGAVRAVVTVVAPSERFGPREKRKNTEAVKSSAAEMTRYLSRATSAAR